jgi:hypothetical protein
MKLLLRLFHSSGVSTGNPTELEATAALMSPRSPKGEHTAVEPSHGGALKPHPSRSLAH